MRTLHETLKLGEYKTLLAISSEIKLTNTEIVIQTLTS